MRRGGIALLLLPPAAAAVLFLVLGQTAMAGKSATFDEGVHLLSGWRLLTASDHVFNHEHPPLMKALAAAPIVLRGAGKPIEPWDYRREIDAWRLSHDWLHHVNDADRLLRLGRMPVAMLGAALAAGLFAVTRRLIGGTAGPAAASAAAALFALEPNLLAHGSLVTTDMGMTAFFFGTTAAFWLFLETRGAGWLALTGIFFGLALLAKFTAVLALPVLAVLGLAHERSRRRAEGPSAPAATGRAASSRTGAAAGARGGKAGRRERGRKETKPAAPESGEAAPIAGAPGAGAILGWWRRPVGWLERAGGPWVRLAASIAVVAAAAVIVLNLGYGFDGSFSSLSGTRLESESFRGWAKGALGALPLPVPAAWVQGFDHAEAGGQRWWSYLKGRHSTKGWAHYYLTALLVKTSIPLLLLAAAGVILWRRLGASRGALAFAVLPAAVLLAVFTFSMNLKNIGLRYVLPVYPFLCLLGGAGAVALWRSRRLYGRAAAALLLVWVGAEEARIYPDHLAYFNEAAGGPEGGRRWLVDSNLDWGQDLKGLARWMKENDVPRIYLDYFGRACPRYYGVARSADFEGGLLAVSATNLVGVYRPDERARYDFLRGVEPVASIGHSILIYDVPRPPGWTPVSGQEE